jgi:hypothetical protein
MNIRTATGPIKLYMKLCGFRGWASFWNTIYLMPGSEEDASLIRHEVVHLDQIERDGRLLFSLKYLYWTLRYGYWNNPYEVEARAAE